MSTQQRISWVSMFSHFMATHSFQPCLQVDVDLYCKGKGLKSFRVACNLEMLFGLIK